MYAKKGLGQHFIKCGWVIPMLLKTAGVGEKDTILEIGAGTGLLTRALAQKAKIVIAVEKDPPLISGFLHKLAAENENIKIIQGDILKNLALVQKAHGLDARPYKVVANIPYYLTSRLLRLLLEKEPRPELIVLTVQKEVAQRITAKPPKMNKLALATQVFGRPEIIKTVPASCFWPRPAVDSAIIKISNISGQFFVQNRVDETDFFAILRLAFSQKRKTLVNNLKTRFSKEEIEKLLEKRGLSIKTRPSELGLKDWVEIIISK